MRQYQPIWEQIKKNYTATLVAPASMHAALRQAVRQEKFRDAGFKLLLSEAGIKMKLYSTSDEKRGTITFTLVDTTGIRTGDL